MRGNVNWMRARESQLASELFGDDLHKVLPVVRPGRLGHGQLRQRARAARALGAIAASRDDDDDPRGLRPPRGHERRAPRLLCLPQLPDRAVGRPGVDLLHRRHRDRRHARPQRPSPRPLDGDEGRLGRPRLRDRRPRRAARERPAQGPPSARAPVPGRPGPRPDRRGRGDQGGDRRPRAVRQVVRRGHRASRRPARARAARPARGAAPLAPARVRLHARRT